MEKAERQPGIEKAISEINDNDFRVRILGTAQSADAKNCKCEIDDGTGKALAFFESQEQLLSIEAGKLLRVIGKVRKNGKSAQEIEIDVEVVQDMNNLDLGLLEETREVLEKLKGLR